MDLKQIEAFVRVAELGSFTRAALALNMAQPALSRQVRQLEVQLRQTLLVRNGRGATPTEAGKLLLAHGRGILHQVTLAQQELGTARGALAGRVCIGLPPSLSRLIAVPLAHAFAQQLPQAQLSLIEGFSVRMAEALRLGELDLALLYNPTPGTEWQVTPLHEDALVLISAATSGKASRQPITLAQLARLPLILPSRPNAFRLLIDQQLLALGCQAQLALEVDGLNAILSLVKEGMGHAVLPAYTLDSLDHPRAFTTRRIISPRLASQLALVRCTRRPSTATQDQAAQVLKTVVIGAFKSQAKSKLLPARPYRASTGEWPAP